MSGTKQTLNICSQGYCFLKRATLTEFPSTAIRQPHTVINVVQSTTFFSGFEPLFMVRRQKVLM